MMQESIVTPRRCKWRLRDSLKSVARVHYHRPSQIALKMCSVQEPHMRQQNLPSRASCSRRLRLHFQKRNHVLAGWRHSHGLIGRNGKVFASGKGSDGGSLNGGGSGSDGGASDMNNVDDVSDMNGGNHENDIDGRNLDQGCSVSGSESEWKKASSPSSKYSSSVTTQEHTNLCNSNGSSSASHKSLYDMSGRGRSRVRNNSSGSGESSQTSTSQKGNVNFCVTDSRRDSEKGSKWTEWQRHFHKIDVAEASCRSLRASMKEAIKDEQYAEAAKLRNRIEKQMRETDCVGMVGEKLQNAILEERYSDAVNLRDEGGQALLGWWAGKAIDSDNRKTNNYGAHPFGHLVNISAAHGRYLAKVYAPYDLLDGYGEGVETEMEELVSKGTSVFEIFVKEKTIGRQNEDASLRGSQGKAGKCSFNKQACAIRHKLLDTVKQEAQEKDDKEKGGKVEKTDERDREIENTAETRNFLSVPIDDYELDEVDVANSDSDGVESISKEDNDESISIIADESDRDMLNGKGLLDGVWRIDNLGVGFDIINDDEQYGLNELKENDVAEEEEEDDDDKKFGKDSNRIRNNFDDSLDEDLEEDDEDEDEDDAVSMGGVRVVGSLDFEVLTGGSGKSSIDDDQEDGDILDSEKSFLTISYTGKLSKGSSRRNMVGMMRYEDYDDDIEEDDDDDNDDDDDDDDNEDGITVYYEDEDNEDDEYYEIDDKTNSSRSSNRRRKHSEKKNDDQFRQTLVEINLADVPAIEEAIAVAGGAKAVSIRERANLHMTSLNTFLFEKENESTLISSSSTDDSLSRAQRPMESHTDDKLGELDEEDKETIRNDILSATKDILRSRIGSKHLSKTTEFRRLPDNICSGESHDPFEGLFVGTFGPHGPEIIQMRRGYWGHDRVDDMNCVTAFKVTGDDNVPAGEPSFRVRMDEKIPSLSSSYPSEIGMLGRYTGEGRLAKQGYKDPSWVRGEMIHLDGKMDALTSGASIGFAWLIPGERRYMILFHRLKLPT